MVSYEINVNIIFVIILFSYTLSRGYWMVITQYSRFLFTSEDNTFVIVNKDFYVTRDGFAYNFHVACGITRDPEIVIGGNSCIILYIIVIVVSEIISIFIIEIIFILTNATGIFFTKLAIIWSEAKFIFPPSASLYGYMLMTTSTFLLHYWSVMWGIHLSLACGLSSSIAKRQLCQNGCFDSMCIVI